MDQLLIKDVKRDLGFGSGVSIDAETIRNNTQVFVPGSRMNTVQYAMRWMDRTGRLSGTAVMWMRSLDANHLVSWMVRMANAAAENTPAATAKAVYDYINAHRDEILEAR